MARELAILYGNLMIGGSSVDYLLDGWTRHSVAAPEAHSSIEFDCVVVAQSAATLSALCGAIERQFRTPRLPLSVTQSGVKLIEASHASAVGGINTQPEIRKVGDVGDSGRSRRYSIRISYETPADTVPTPGLRESSVNVEYDAARIRSVRISGAFTGVPSTPSARTRYNAAIAAHAAAVLSGLGITASELVGEPVSESDYDDKVLRFERRYTELIFGQGQDSPGDDPDIVAQSLTVARREWSEEHSPVSAVAAASVGVAGGLSGAGQDASPLAVFDLQYEATISRGTDPYAKYQSIRAWLVGQFSAVFSQGAFALMSERPAVDRAANVLSVSMSAEGSVRGGSLVRRHSSRESRVSTGVVFRGAWTGDPLSHYTYRGFETHLTVSTVSARYLLTGTAADAEADTASAAHGFGGGGTVVEMQTTTTPVRIGIQGSGHTIDMVDVTSVVTTRKHKPVGQSGVQLGSLPPIREQPGPAIFGGGLSGQF